MVYYEINCLQGSPLSSWSDVYTRSEIIDKFYSYAQHEWDRANKRAFTLDFIAEMWQVEFKRLNRPALEELARLRCDPALYYDLVGNIDTATDYDLVEVINNTGKYAQILAELEE